MKNLDKRASDKIDAFLKKNWTLYTIPQLAEKLNTSDSTIMRHARKLRLPRKSQMLKPLKEISISDQIAIDRQVKKLSKTKSTTDKKYKELLGIIEEKERLLEAQKVLDEVSSFKINIKKDSNTSRATAFIIASDWHSEELVSPETVDHLNEYNLEIAEARATEFFQASQRLLSIFSKDIKIDKVVLALLGDFISGTIHDDLMETNQLSPSHALIFAERLIISGIEFLLKETEYEFVIVCHSGNHGRMTKKQRIASEQGNSLELLMYHHIARIFKDNPRVKMVIAGGYHSFLEVYDYTIRFHHGHSINYGGGVGGITIAVNKAIAQWNKARNVYLDVFGHFHQYFDGGNFVCNGSLIGWNAFAVSIKGSFDRPKQMFFLLDEKRGKTITTPIVFTK